MPVKNGCNVVVSTRERTLIKGHRLTLYAILVLDIVFENFIEFYPYWHRTASSVLRTRLSCPGFNATVRYEGFGTTLLFRGCLVPNKYHAEVVLPIEEQDAVERKYLRECTGKN